MKKPLSGCLALSLMWFSANLCQAHQKWLLPNFFVAEKSPVWLSFDVTWSDRPFTAESGVGEQPLWIIHPDGRREPPTKVFVGKTKSVAEVELSTPGTHRVEAIDPLTYWTQVETDGQSKWVRQPKSEVSEGNITRSDLYWSKALAYVTLGEPSEVSKTDDADPLSIVLTQHPNKLAVGDKLELRILSYGQPVPNAEIKMFGPSATGHEPTETIRCDEEGAGAIELTTSGRFLLAGELERKTPDDPKADLHSFHVYLTLEIQPKQP